MRIMKSILGKTVLSSFIFLLFFSYNSFDAFAQSPRARALEGLTEIWVVVENILPDFKEDLDTDQIKNDIELKLRMAGIKAGSLSELKEGIKSGMLLINLTLMGGSRTASGLIFFNIRLELFQDAIISSNQQKMAVTTWKRSKLGTVGRSNISILRNIIKDELDFFINDYLSINPKP